MSTDAEAVSHTPGPWVQVAPKFKPYGAGSTFRIQAATAEKIGWHGYVADVACSSPNAEANAKLIAAAAEMLAALKAALPYFVSGAVPHIQKQMLAAIAKAEGRDV